MDGLKLNLGCGSDYRDGFVNVDCCRNVKTDVCVDLCKLPFETNTVAYIMMRHSLEHIARDKICFLFDSIYRICKPNAVVEIWVPHYTAISAFALCHQTQWTIQSLEVFDGNHKDEVGSVFICQVDKKELHFWKVGTRSWIDKLGLRYLNCTWFWNGFGEWWQRAWERFNVFGFDEIYYKLMVTQ